MTSWLDIQKEIEQGKSPEKPGGDYDAVRRLKYGLIKQITGRPLLVYATAFHVPQKSQIAAPFLPIDLSDKDGFHEIMRNINVDEVDVYIHSPGGSAEATESIVRMLRSKYKVIRFIITGTAKSAATMLALSGDSILMNKSAELGPIDPQVRVKGRYSPAGSIKEQFRKASIELSKNPARLPVWIPILQEFAPSLLVECDNFIKLSKSLVQDWLTKYMFQNKSGARRKAIKIARFLTDEKKSLSHARRIDAEQLRELGVVVDLIEDLDERAQDACQQLHLSIMATLDSTQAVKIFENSEGAALIRGVQVSPVRPGNLPIH